MSTCCSSGANVSKQFVCGLGFSLEYAVLCCIPRRRCLAEQRKLKPSESLPFRRRAACEIQPDTAIPHRRQCAVIYTNWDNSERWIFYCAMKQDIRFLLAPVRF